MNKALAPWRLAIQEAEKRFVTIADRETWAQESMFAMQAITKNEYLMKIANLNPASLRNAVTNVAAIGLSLNPATAFAYIVPRDNQACLDISYKGLIKLATDSGAIQWAQAENVYSNDTFTYNGPTENPMHSYDPFTKDRGEYQGSYCIARTAGGDVLVEVMTASEINEIRDKSDMYKRTKRGPWKDFPGEMRKKTVIKRASKTWPKSVASHKLDQAIEMLNESGEGIKFEPDYIEVKDSFTLEQKEKFTALLNDGDSLGMYVMEHTIPRSAWIDLYNSFEKGEKGKMKAKVDALTAQGLDIKDSLVEAIQRDDTLAVHELISTANHDMLSQLPPLLGLEDAHAFVDIVKAD